jgi:hypothetical protein
VSSALPKDARLVELRADALTLQTRQCELPGTALALTLLLEGQPIHLNLAVGECLVMAKDRRGYLYHLRLPLCVLSEADRSLIGLFISKGRGAPEISSWVVGKVTR